jgi:hypothetical protein
VFHGFGFRSTIIRLAAAKLSPPAMIEKRKLALHELQEEVARKSLPS